MKLGNTDISKIYLGSTEVTKGMLGSTEVYSSGPNYSEPFYVEDISGSSNTLSIVKNNSSAPTLTIEKSTDGTTWETMGTTSTTAITATVTANGKLYLRADTKYLNWYTSYTTIKAAQNFKVGGNVMSLLYGSNFTGNETSMRYQGAGMAGLAGLFENSTNLVSAEDLLLPATTFTAYGEYLGMFKGCTSLVKPPKKLPVTTLTTSCYTQMFDGCTALTTAPELPATTLAGGCYNAMFNRCTSLTVAPELPATTLVKICYQQMFYGCTSLNYIKVHFTTWPNMNSSSASDNDATYQWTQLTRNTTGTFVCPSTLYKYFNASNNNTTGNATANATNAIPYGWTVETF